MRKIGLAWGAVAVLCGAAAQAAPKNATPPATGAAGAAATAPSASASGATPAAGAPAAGAPAAPDASAPAAPVDGAAPAAPDAAATPPTEPAPEVDDEEEEEERAREAARRKRKRKRQLQFDAAEDEADNESRAPLAPEAPASERWRLVGSHFMLSVERATNVLSWSVTETESVTTTGFNGFPETTNFEVERSGTDVSFLGSGGVSQNPFAVPRIAFDGMFGNGFTLGGSLSYLVTSGKYTSTGGSSSESPTTSIFLLAPRIGVVIPASPTIGIWLRGGITRISASTDAKLATGDGATTNVTSTATFVDLTLDPQLVISPVPHVGITLGLALDIGVGGTVEASNSTTTHDVKASSYGATGGLVAIF